MFPTPHHDKKMGKHFKEPVESGQFTPVIDRTCRSDQILEA